MIITVFCEDNCLDDTIRETAKTLNHEEVAHGINKLKGIIKPIDVEHKEFHGDKSFYSPTSNEIKTMPKYERTESRKQLDEIDKIMGNE